MPRPRYTPGERTPGTHCAGGWVGPRAVLDVEAIRKILCLCRGSNPGRPVRSQTLYWLRYLNSIYIYFSKKICRLVQTDGIRQMAVSMKMAVFWVVAPCSKHLWNISKLLPDYTTQQPRRQPPSRHGLIFLLECTKWNGVWKCLKTHRRAMSL
jgi:hypothetical protein